ncbi:hypothetical protein [Neoroseomonas soli]|uniref:Uncharacterized protein n=1 Tax=Neoroseomonas soli TaxID=1081025 RepID=A0A9X9WV48_9PROT|nr:hypothetical protein [Neoroseomonas soli]MBR0671027.1 hypothetical protein [Neoroseomonas soli]
MLDRLIVVDSVTRLGPEAQGRVIVGGSHGGIYAAYLSAKARVAGVLLNDAGLGLDRAGIAGLDHLDPLGIPAACCSHRSARIGDGFDLLGRGIVSHVNRAAAALGIEAGMWCREAARRLAAAPVPAMDAPDSVESRFPIDLPGLNRARACAMDSNSLMTPDDDGTVVVTGSHGGLLGGRPESAARAAVFAALYNDADGGIDGAGYTRLPALDARGIAAATYSAWTARIGDGRSAVATGIVSAVNRRAASLGLKPGGTVRDAVTLLAEAIEKDHRA